MRKAIFAALVLSGAGLALSSCSGSADKADTAEAPEGIPGLTITNGRLMLPPVSGNPAAVYFDLAYDGDKNIAIRRADVEGAESAQLHDMMEYNFEQTMGEMPPLMLQPGDKVSFAPGGKHVMAYNLSPELAAGGTTEVTLTIAGGDKQSFPVTIQAAGDER